MGREDGSSRGIGVMPTGLILQPTYQIRDLRPAVSRPSLRVLSLDIETTPDASRLLSVALVGCGSEEVHLIAQRALHGAVVHPDERQLLTALLARVRALDPDVLLGWNVVDF